MCRWYYVSLGYPNLCQKRKGEGKLPEKWYPRRGLDENEGPVEGDFSRQNAALSQTQREGEI